MFIVTKHNFEQIFPQLEEDIKTCTFISYDSEYTGLAVNESVQPSLFDTPDERYKKQKISASSVITCQVGLSIYKFDLIENKFTSKIYSFYLCPRSHGNQRGKGFYIDSGSIEFLCDHGFDFNLFVRDGISYLNQVQEKELIKNFEIQFTDLYDVGSHEFAELIKLCSSISNWINTIEAQNGFVKPLLIDFDSSINPFNNYLYLKELRNRFTKVWIELKDTQFCVMPIDEKLKGNLHLKLEEEKQKLIDSLLGFTRVFRCLVHAKKPLVGHNMMLDLLQMYQQFYKPLPSDLNQYKESIHNLLPIIYDTKCIICNEMKEINVWVDLKEAKSLGQFFTFLQEDKLSKIRFFPSIEQVSNGNNNNFSPHNAGFDAFATGYVFIRVSHILVLNKRKCSSNGVSRFDFGLDEFFSALHPHQNKINLIRAKAHCLNLEKNDYENKYERPEWLFVETKNSYTLSVKEIGSLLSAYCTTDIKLMNKNQALIALSSYRMSRKIIEAFKDHQHYKITKYNMFKHSKSFRILLWSTFSVASCLSVLFTIKIIKS